MLVLLSAVAAHAEKLDCGTNRRMEVISYRWELTGALSWFAGLRFPTDGNGSLATVTAADSGIETELRIISSESDRDLYQYQSQIDPTTTFTLTSLDGYRFEGRQRSLRTSFDYSKQMLSTEKRDTKRGKAPRTKTAPIPAGEIRDVLSTIHFLRTRSGSMTRPLRTKVYSAGKLYEVLLTPGETKNLVVSGKLQKAKKFTISATPEERKKWPGDVVVWLTLDSSAVPVRIILRQKMAALDLVAEGVYTCP